MAKKIFTVLFYLFIGVGNLYCQGTRFAIVLDSVTYTKVKPELEAYKAVLDSEGLPSQIYIDRYYNPDSIRQHLHQLYKNEAAFEGAVFIGDIPIPMIRDAQHLTSAFKMDQDVYAWNKSSVPSDRFYEDFDLTFRFLKQDSLTPAYFYYSLTYDSPQTLQPDIYSGRIRIPRDPDGKKLKLYLQKVVAAHREQNTVDKVFFFAGHGYNSESWTARMDEKVTLLQQFPNLNTQQNGLDYADHSFELHIKNSLLFQLSREDLDIALLHHHGAPTAQYLNGTQKVDGVNQSIDNIKYYLRSKLQDAVDRKKDIDKTIDSYVEAYGVPREWFGNIADTAQQKADSAYWNGMDISTDELNDYSSNARFIVFDACFNGSFHKPDYVSARYVFGNGKTAAAQGNTVNVYQDKFPDRMVGLLGLGMRVGEWNRYVCYLESHILGDPTFRFVSSSRSITFDKLNRVRKNNKKLMAVLSTGTPDVKSWALRNLYNNGYTKISDLAKSTFISSENGTVRMECLLILSEIRDDNFIQVLQLSFNDSYELVRRFAGIFAWKTGDPRIAPCVVKSLLNPNCSKRVCYQLRDAVSFFEREWLLSSMYLAENPSKYEVSLMEDTKKFIDSSWASYEGYMKDITAPESSGKDRGFAIRSLRNKTFHQGIPLLTSYLLQCGDEQTQLSLLEALGWFRYSYNRQVIIQSCNQLVNSEKYSARVKEEAQRTINRLL
ncbi:MAG: HEAT repeat domain-containing protein [Bacteroidales bacterium]